MRSLIACAVLLSACAHAPPGDERVTFDSLARDASGAPVRISARFIAPADPAPGHPAVIALHGCGGMYSAIAGREEQISAQLAAWAARFTADGYAVLIPDSFGSRGVREVCTINFGERTITVAMRRLDALGALAFLASRQEVGAGRIALVGWSHGGSTALAAINAKDPRVAAFRAARGTAPFFRAAVAFYPGCAGPVRAGAGWEPAARTEILIGGSDDWTPAAACAELGTGMAARGAPLSVTVYPGAYHGFDAPLARSIVRKDVPNGVNPGQGVTLAPDPQARADAINRVQAFLRDTIGAPSNDGAATRADRFHYFAP